MAHFDYVSAIAEASPTVQVIYDLIRLRTESGTIELNQIPLS